MGGGGGCCVAACCIGQIFGCCIGDTVKTIVNDIFGCGDKGSSDVGKQESYQNSTATLEATIKVQEALSQFQSTTQSRSAKLENAIVKESRENLDAFIDELKKYNKIRYGNRRLNINLSHIERENRKTEDKIHGFIVKRVTKRISLDDDECKEILKMPAGDEKQRKMEEFYKAVLKEAIRELSDELQTNMETQTNTICDRIQQRIDNIIDVCENKTEEFENIRKVKEKDEAAVEQEQLRLTHFVAMCEYGLELLD